MIRKAIKIVKAAAVVVIALWKYKGDPMPYREPKYTFFQALVGLALSGVFLWLAYNFIFNEKDIGFLAGFFFGFFLWQLNYRNYYGRWFSYSISREQRE